MRPRRYYQFVAKDENDVSKIWKALHIFLFMLTGLVSLFGAQAFCAIFDIFNYRCILYAKASTKFTDIIYKNITKINATEEFLQNFRLNLGIFDLDYDMEMHDHVSKFSASQAVKVPGVKDIYILDNEIWINNDTLLGRAHVGMTTTVFESVFLCDFVVFVPFISVIICAVFSLIVVLFSRTGRNVATSSPPAFIYVYPLLTAASIMSVLSVAAFNLLNNGINQFCSHFRHLTGRVECSPLMDYFTKEQRLGHRHLYHEICIGKMTYFITVLLWIAQLCVGLLRLFSTADYYLTATLIKTKKRWEDEDAEDIFHMYWDEHAAQLAEVVEKLEEEPKIM